MRPNQNLTRCSKKIPKVGATCPNQPSAASKPLIRLTPNLVKSRKASQTAQVGLTRGSHDAQGWSGLHGIGARDNVRSIKAATVYHGLERGNQSHHRFRRAQHEITVSRDHLRDALKHTALHVLLKIQEHIPAEDDIKNAELRQLPNQVQRSKLHHGSDRRRDLPTLADLGQILE